MTFSTPSISIIGKIIAYLIGCIGIGVSTNLWANEVTSSHVCYIVSDPATWLDAETLDKNNINITADKVRYQSESAYFSGDVKILHKNLRITGDEATYDTTMGQGHVDNAALTDTQTRLHARADNIRFTEDQQVNIKQGVFSYCPPQKESWRITGSDIDIDQQAGIATAHHAIFYLGSIPIFYTPWIRAPINNQRLSGFLIPELTHNSSSGTRLSLPYYANLNPAYDLIITPQHSEHRKLALLTQGRLLTQAWDGIHYTDTFFTQDPLSEQTRWYLGYRFSGSIGSRSRLNINLKRASDIDVFADYDLEADNIDTDKITNQITWEYAAAKSWLQNITVGATSYQQLTSAAPSYQNMPYIHATANHLFDNHQQLGYAFSYDTFDRSNDLVAPNLQVNGQRINIMPAWQYHYQTSYGFLKGQVTTPMTAYKLTDDTNNPTRQGLTQQPKINTYQLSLDSGLWLERDYGTQGYQTLEPRIFWTYTPYEAQHTLPVFDTSPIEKPLYQARRFTGYDRFGDSHRVTLGIKSQVYDDTQNLKALYSLAQIHYLDDRQVQLPGTATATETYSPIYGQIQYQHNRAFNTQLSIDWQPDTSTLEQATATLLYQPSSDNLAKLEYTLENNLKAQQAEQIQLTWGGNLSILGATNWLALAQYEYNLTEHQMLRQAIALSYVDCCWGLQLAVAEKQQDQEIKRSILIELNLLGLNSKTTNTLNQNRLASNPTDVHKLSYLIQRLND